MEIVTLWFDRARISRRFQQVNDHQMARKDLSVQSIFEFRKLLAAIIDDKNKTALDSLCLCSHCPREWWEKQKAEMDGM